MQTNLITNIDVCAICEGFIYNELEGKGLYGLSGKLTIQPEYQRNYIYAADGGKREMAERYLGHSPLLTEAPAAIESLHAR